MEEGSQITASLQDTLILAEVITDASLIALYWIVVA